MALDYPPQGYFPAWKVKLIVRFEEFDQGVLKGKVPQTISKNLKGIKADRAPLSPVPDPEHPGRFLLKATGGNVAADKSSVAGDSSSDGLTHVVSGIIPQKFDWRQNGFRTADELKIQLRWIDFPIDPRIVRAVAVAFYLGTVTETEFAQGLRGVTRTAAGGAREPLNVVADAYLDGNNVRRTNLRFTGWGVKMKMTRSPSESMVEFECQDNTRLLLNQIAPPQLVLGMDDPIDKSVATYLSNFPQFAGLTVEYRGDPGSEVPKLKGALAGTAFRPKLGPQPGSGSGDDLVVWDYLTDICGSIGHVIRIDGNEIVIQRPSTLLHGKATPRADDPYKGRTLPSGTFGSRAFVWGRNVDEFDVSRDLSNNETKNVEVRCWSPRRKQLLVARFPNKENRIATSTPGDARADNKWTVKYVRGIEDKAVLQRIAEDYFHGRNRNEIEVSFKTINFASFGGGNEDPDLLDLKAGDAVEIYADSANPSTDAEVEASLRAATPTQKMLEDLGFETAFAAAAAKAYANAGFQRLYRVREMGVSGDLEEGVSFEIRGANFVQVRGDAVPPAPAPAKPSGSSKATQGGGGQSKPSNNQGQVKQSSSKVADAGSEPQAPPGFKVIGMRADGSPILKKL